MATEKTLHPTHVARTLLSESNEVDLEKLAEEIVKQIVNDDEVPRRKGFQVLKAYLENPEAADNMLMALCGWSMRSLLIFAGLLPDDEGLLSH